VVIGDRLQALREAKGFSQEDIEKLTGLPCFYISRVENGDAVPSVGALEKMASALEIPLHQLFYDGDEPPSLSNLPNRLTAADIALRVPGEDKLSFMKFDQRMNSLGGVRRSARSTEAEVISIFLSESCPSETSHSFGNHNSHKNLIQNSLGAANKT
jgi:transcriptional regulator with XRE-family HTH domain